MKKKIARLLGIGICLLFLGRMAPINWSAEPTTAPPQNPAGPSLSQPPTVPPPTSPPLLIEAPQSPTGPNTPVTVPATVVPAPATVAPAPGNLPPPDASAVTDTNAPVDLAADENSEADEVIPLVTFDDVELLSVIKSLARQANIKFLLDPRVEEPGPTGKAPVERKVSLRMENITARQVLDAVLKNYGLQLAEDPKTGISRVTIKDPAAMEPLLTKVIQLQYCSPTNMVALLTAAFPPTTRARFLPDSRSSQVLILAVEKDMENIEKLLRSLDSPTRQVLIEARLMETSTSPSSVKGIDWSGTLEAQRVTFGNGITTGQTITTSPGETTSSSLPSGRTTSSTESYSAESTWNTSVAGGDSAGGSGGANSALSALNSAAGLGLNTANGFYPGIAFLNADGVSAVLSFLNKNSDTEVVATPRAVTLDNETATLSITRAYPIFNITPGSANSPAGSQTLYTNLGTILEVTPRISGSNNIALRIAPEVSNIDSKDTQTINGEVNQANVYAIRKIETHVLVPSGNTLVMGGLINDAVTKSYTKVPILGDLPLVGLAFRQDTKKRVKQNLLIFITPTIVRDNDFQLNPPSNFLKTPPIDRTSQPVSAWDSGTPYKWTKKASN